MSEVDIAFIVIFSQKRPPSPWNCGITITFIVAKMALPASRRVSPGVVTMIFGVEGVPVSLKSIDPGVKNMV